MIFIFGWLFLFNQFFLSSLFLFFLKKDQAFSSPKEKPMEKKPEKKKKPVPEQWTQKRTKMTRNATNKKDFFVVHFKFHYLLSANIWLFFFAAKKC